MSSIRPSSRTPQPGTPTPAPTDAEIRRRAIADVARVAGPAVVAGACGTVVVGTAACALPTLQTLLSGALPAAPEALTTGLLAAAGTVAVHVGIATWRAAKRAALSLMPAEWSLPRVPAYEKGRQAYTASRESKAAQLLLFRHSAAWSVPFGVLAAVPPHDLLSCMVAGSTAAIALMHGAGTVLGEIRDRTFARDVRAELASQQTEDVGSGR